MLLSSITEEVAEWHSWWLCFTDYLHSLPKEIIVGVNQSRHKTLRESEFISFKSWKLQRNQPMRCQDPFPDQKWKNFCCRFEIIRQQLCGPIYVLKVMCDYTGNHKSEHRSQVISYCKRKNSGIVNKSKRSFAAPDVKDNYA